LAIAYQPPQICAVVILDFTSLDIPRGFPIVQRQNHGPGSAANPISGSVGGASGANYRCRCPWTYSRGTSVRSYNEDLQAMEWAGTESSAECERRDKASLRGRCCAWGNSLAPVTQP